MGSEADKTLLDRFAEVLASHGVEFIVIGGQAENLHGSPRVTYDVDLCYRRTKENLERLAAALPKLEPTLRGAPPDLPFRIDARALALGSNYVEPLGGYDEIVRNAVEYRLDEVSVKTIGLEDLIRIKEHIRRPKDQDSLLQLRAIQREQARSGSESGPDSA